MFFQRCPQDFRITFCFARLVRGKAEGAGEPTCMLYEQLMERPRRANFIISSLAKIRVCVCVWGGGVVQGVCRCSINNVFLMWNKGQMPARCQKEKHYGLKELIVIMIRWKLCLCSEIQPDTKRST